MTKPDVLPLQQLEQLEQSDMIATLQQYRATYTIKDLTQAWGLNNPIQYYMWLRKHQIYDQLVRKTDKFEPTKEWKRTRDVDGGASLEDRRVKGLPADQFRYGLDTESSGPELAMVFRRLADFLSNEAGSFRCRIELKAIQMPATSMNEWKEEEPGA
ncbi:hypothetical protein [Cohnella sp. 56]|uniref:hypothetical protein n=1 Tax=Cohnella sp. 56 TaxID=3113722 RepID=UPI0030E9FB61